MSNDKIIYHICNMPANCRLPLFVQSINYMRLKQAYRYLQPITQRTNPLIIYGCMIDILQETCSFFHYAELCHKNRACILKNKVFHNWTINRNNDFIGGDVNNTLWRHMAKVISVNISASNGFLSNYTISFPQPMLAYTAKYTSGSILAQVGSEPSCQSCHAQWFQLIINQHHPHP